MNRIFVLLIFILVLSCKTTQNKAQDVDCLTTSEFFKILESEQTFQTEHYKTQLDTANVVLVNNDSIKRELISLGDDEVVLITTNKKLSVSKSIRYQNGAIKKQHFEYINGSTKIGSESHFNKQGIVTKTIDHDKGYSICFAQAIAIVKQLAKKDIEKHRLDAFYLLRNNLNEFPEAAAEWRVAMKGNESYDQDGTTFYVLDGVSGKLKRKVVSETTY